MAYLHQVKTGVKVKKIKEQVKKNNWQISKKIFSFAFAYAPSEYSLIVNFILTRFFVVPPTPPPNTHAKKESWNSAAIILPSKPQVKWDSHPLDGRKGVFPSRYMSTAADKYR